ncbi:MAG: HIRAN domain-containing protein [Neomegalonema sp.]|nr:HIRAN domain-containing protein [Neomegalonema sp.]
MEILIVLILLIVIGVSIIGRNAAGKAARAIEGDSEGERPANKATNASGGRWERWEASINRPTEGDAKFWRLAEGDHFFQVAGLGFRKTALNKFIASLKADAEQGFPFGLRLERDPTNGFDPNAVKVIGYTTEVSEHIGFVPKEMAREIADALPAETPLAADLKYVFTKPHESGDGVRARMHARLYIPGVKDPWWEGKDAPRPLIWKDD